MSGRPKKFTSHPLAAQKNKFLEKLKALGGRATNQNLRQNIDCDYDAYETVKSALKKEFKIISDRGRGGVVVLLNSDEIDKKINDDCNEVYASERSAYPKIIEHLPGFMGYDKSAYIKDTSSSGRKALGKWRCPDITVVEYNKYDLLKKESIDVTTFEIKIINKVDVSSVYEAMSHARRSTWSYLFVCATSSIPEDKIDVLLYDIKKECVNCGVGLILCKDVNDCDMWHTHIEAKTNNIHPFELNEFVENQIAIDKRFREWFKTSTK